MTAVSKPQVMVVFGTRPEAIKMAPIVRELRSRAAELTTYVAVTAQHRNLLDEVLTAFDLTPDHDLDLMRPDQQLATVMSGSLAGLDGLFRDQEPDIILVQGDTTTALAGALAAYYRKIPVGHIEAGLRTGDKFNPFPEEINRRMIGTLADLSFAPTSTTRDALLAEGIPPERILVTGNTVIDALLTVLAATTQTGEAGRAATVNHLFAEPALGAIVRDPGPILLATAHRRESLGPPLRAICEALRELLIQRPELRLVFPVHPNPNVRSVVFSILGDSDRAHLLEPLGYVDFVHLMRRSHLIVTDSGGVQEEAPSLDKPVLVVRDRTERPEGLHTGASRLVGTDRQAIIDSVSSLLDDRGAYARMAEAKNPYGDGRAAKRIVESIRHFLGLRDRPPSPFA